MLELEGTNGVTGFFNNIGTNRQNDIKTSAKKFACLSKQAFHKTDYNMTPSSESGVLSLHICFVAVIRYIQPT